MTRARLLIGLGAALVLILIILAIYHRGERAGSNAVTVKAERQHDATVVDARSDERSAAQVAQSIATSTARADVAADALVRSTIEDLRHALDVLPPAVAGDPLPPAPDSLRDTINAGVDRANRAADAAASPP